MKKAFLIISLTVGILGLKAQDLTLGYQLVDLGNNNYRVEIHARNNTVQTLSIGAINLSLAYQSSCLSYQSLWSVFNQQWGNLVAYDQSMPFNLNYQGVSYDQRWQYGNTDPNFLSPAAIDIPANGGNFVHVQDVDFQSSCNPQVYLENQSENFANEITNLSGIGIPYDIQPMAGAFPVEFLDFTAQQLGVKTVGLDWVTASETDNDYFLVERSVDLVSFSVVGKVQGKGNSQQTQLYSFTDKDALGVVFYYRLKQVDLNGEFTYSELREVKMVEGQFSPINCYPNPTSNSLYLSRESGELEHFSLMIYDQNGKEVFHSPSLGIGSNPVEISVEDLPPGIYQGSLLEEKSERIFLVRFVRL